MGADIHMFVEYKVGDSPWQADKNHKTIEEDDDYSYLDQFPFSGRNYDLFGALAGVRTDGPEPKGLPKDVSEIIKSNTEEGQYGDDHSHSYISFTEYKKVLRKQGYKLKTLEKERIEWDITIEYSHRYVAGVAYIEQQLKKLKMDLEAEKMLLGQDINTNVEARLVFWFDN